MIKRIISRFNLKKIRKNDLKNDSKVEIHSNSDASSISLGFFDKYAEIQKLINDISSQLEEGSDFDQSLIIRRNRVYAIYDLVESFGTSESYEIESHFIDNPNETFESLVISFKNYITLGIEDCKKLKPVFFEEKDNLDKISTRLECWALYWQANILYASDKYVEAMSSFQRILNKDADFPKKETILTSLGLAWEHIFNDFTKAEAMYSEVIRLKEESISKGHKNFIKYLKSLNKEKPVFIEPNNIENLKYIIPQVTPIEALALALERRGDLRMKSKLYRKALNDFNMVYLIRAKDPLIKKKMWRARFSFISIRNYLKKR